MLIFFSGSCNQTFSLKYIVKWETSSRILIEHYLLVSLTLKKKRREILSKWYSHIKGRKIQIFELLYSQTNTKIFVGICAYFSKTF